jgi:hypothetical protein
MRRFMEIHRAVFHPHIRSSVRVMRENKRKAIFCEQRRDHNGAQFFHKRANSVGVKAPAHLTYRTRTNATRKGEIVAPCICRKSFFSTLFALRLLQSGNRVAMGCEFMLLNFPGFRAPKVSRCAPVIKAMESCLRVALSYQLLLAREFVWPGAWKIIYFFQYFFFHDLAFCFAEMQNLFVGIALVSNST